MIALLAACVEYEVEPPEPPGVPHDPDGVCPDAFRLGGEPRELRLVASDSEETIVTVVSGASEFDRVPTLTLGFSYSTTTLSDSRTQHFLCDAENVWLVAEMPVLDPDICGCGLADCAAMGVAWDPPRLVWWNEGVGQGLDWSESTEATDYYQTWFDCVEDLRVVDRSEVVIEHVPGEIESVDVPAGTFGARALSVHYGHAAWYTDYWSAEVGYLVKEEQPDLVWDLIAWE